MPLSLFPESYTVPKSLTSKDCVTFREQTECQKHPSICHWGEETCRPYSEKDCPVMSEVICKDYSKMCSWDTTNKLCCKTSNLIDKKCPIQDDENKETPTTTTTTTIIIVGIISLLCCLIMIMIFLSS